MASSIATPQVVRWHASPNEKAFRQQAVDTILGAAKTAIPERGRFDIVLAGGGNPPGERRRRTTFRRPPLTCR